MGKERVDKTWKKSFNYLALDIWVVTFELLGEVQVGQSDVPHLLDDPHLLVLLEKIEYPEQLDSKSDSEG